MWVDEFVKKTIESNTIEDSAKILNKSEIQIYSVINRYKLNYQKKCALSKKSKEILAEIEKGELSQSEISRKYKVSRQYVSKLKQKWVEKQKVQHILL